MITLYLSKIKKNSGGGVRVGWEGYKKVSEAPHLIFF